MLIPAVVTWKSNHVKPDCWYMMVNNHILGIPDTIDLPLKRANPYPKQSKYCPTPIFDDLIALNPVQQKSQQCSGRDNILAWPPRWMSMLPSCVLVLIQAAELVRSTTGIYLDLEALCRRMLSQSLFYASPMCIFTAGPAATSGSTHPQRTKALLIGMFIFFLISQA